MCVWVYVCVFMYVCILSSQKKRLLATDKVASNVDKATTTATTLVDGERRVGEVETVA